MIHLFKGGASFFVSVTGGRIRPRAEKGKQTAAPLHRRQYESNLLLIVLNALTRASSRSVSKWKMPLE